MAKRIGKRTVTVVREPMYDRLDEPVQGPVQEFPIDGCAITPRASHEEGRGWIIIEGRMVVAPFGADVRAQDRVRVDGELWEVDGEPGDYEDKNAKGKATIFYLTRRGNA